MSDARLEELAANLERVRSTLPETVTLIAVSKTWPAADVLRLASLGVTDFGESYAQEAAPKAAQVAEAGATVRWHHVGQIQRNKARQVAEYAHVVQSLDRVVLVDALHTGARLVQRRLDVLVQVDFGAEMGRGGCPPEDALDLAALLRPAPDLRLRGLMTVAPLGTPPGPVFARLAALGTQLGLDEPPWLSMGMSGDYREAIEAGATHVRVGTALFGSRTPPPG